MISVEECVVAAMDGDDKELFSFLPYILQDIWEIGTCPDSVIHILKKYFPDKAISVLDLGCGKGAVSVKVAAALQCSYHGINALPEFISFAKLKAKEFEVSHLCIFETADIRAKIPSLEKYDVIICK